MVKDKKGQPWVLDVKILTEGKTALLDVRLSESDNPKAQASISITKAEQTAAKIEDITVNRLYENRGIGSLMIRAMESWARTCGVETIWGELSEADRDHFDKLKHFYEKHGYVFKLDNPSGSIPLRPRSAPVGTIRKDIGERTP